MQPANESAGMFWPVRAFFRDIVTDQIGGDAQSGLRPLPPHWVGLAIHFGCKLPRGPSR